MKRKVVILGSTGSIGVSTLQVIENQKDEFEVIGLACRENGHLFVEQIRRFSPKYACVYEESLRDKIDFGASRPLAGSEGLKDLMKTEADIVVNALPGSVGLEPTIMALQNNLVLALANKESLVMAGRLVRRLLKEKGGTLIPVDSEHSALYQLMEGLEDREIQNLTITASGGPFRDYSKERLREVTVEAALCHPTWKMGRKVTIDSATLMNKGLEVIEAHWLFNVSPERIKVLIHPESIVHGMVQIIDGSLFAYLATPDMKIPIAFALNLGKRRKTPFERIDLAAIGNMNFYTPDTDRFPALRLAYNALETGDSALITFNAANETASQAFFEGRIQFIDIARLVEDALDHHHVIREIEDQETIRDVHNWTKTYLSSRLRRINA